MALLKQLVKERNIDDNKNEGRVIQLISINNGLVTELRRSSTSIIKQFLINNGYDVECNDYFYIMYSRFSKTEYASYVAELADLPKFIPMLKNYRENKDNLLKGIEDEFTEHQWKILHRIDSDVRELEIPDNSVFGFSVTYISHFYCSYYALKLRQKNPNIKIVMGGYHMGFGENVRDFSLISGIVDVVVKDDGCQPMLDVIEGRLTSGDVVGRFSKVPSWPEFSRLDIELSKGIIPSLTSVGCPNQCAFCASKRPFITYDLDKMEEYLIRTKKRSGFTAIELADDNINATVERGIQVCDMMKRVGVQAWHSFGVPRNIHPDFVKGLKESNAVSIFLGAESFNNKVYELMNKAQGQTQDEAIQAIERVCESGVMACVGLIVGLPGETDEDNEYRIKICEYFWSKYGRLYDLLATVFKLFPNSKIYQHPDEFGVKLTYWEDEYVNAIPELREVLSKIPKKFTIDGMKRQDARDRMMKLRSLYPTSGLAKWDMDKKYAEKGAFNFSYTGNTKLDLEYATKYAERGAFDED
ncbi:MAG: radical SAM protein [Candidatus Heimdallarchaeota archaeon]|nr:radical SAM protein [Candidatus Heimdallarchaeota archaeon]